MPPPAPTISTSNGHINFFEDLEQNAIASAVKAKKALPEETDKGVALAPSAKDLNPWYSDSKQKVPDENDDRRYKRLFFSPFLFSKNHCRKRDTARKSVHDPLTSINHQLASSSVKSFPRPRLPPPPPPSSRISSQHPEINARLSRESSERERALALIRRKKRESMGSETPSTVHGGDQSSEYGDMYNRRDVQEAHRLRDRRWEDSSSSYRRRSEGYRWPPAYPLFDCMCVKSSYDACSTDCDISFSKLCTLSSAVWVWYSYTFNSFDWRVCRDCHSILDVSGMHLLSLLLSGCYLSFANVREFTECKRRLLASVAPPGLLEPFLLMKSFLGDGEKFDPNSFILRHLKDDWLDDVSGTSELLIAEAIKTSSYKNSRSSK